MRSLIALGLVGCANAAPGKPITKVELGEQLFNDTRLSEPAGQSCADCHDAKLAFTDPENDRVSAGVIRERFGVRNAPTAMYASFVPPLHRDAHTQSMVGGLFWDGRADSLETQALSPLTNPLEMNNPDRGAVVAKIRRYYGRQFHDVFGKDALTDEATALAHLGDAIAAFERTSGFAPFSSKYDRYLAGTVELAAAEARGLAIFEDPARGNCASCHPSRPGPDGSPPLFTNFSYANIGLPRFADSPFYMLPTALNPDGAAFIDRGLAKTTGDPRDDGLFRVPTLRNIAKTSPYGHNGYMRRLDEMIELLAGTCLRPGTCNPPAPEVVANAQRVRTGTTLSKQDIADLLAFLRTLDDE
ncbi:MAG TPA: cytochrome c peroxidase [Kofleriaceae bacterium]|nr:cytochrome c peroxidase [Kofleriaceae bacterium]